MGYYIEGPTHGKANHILNKHGGTLLPGKPESFADIPDDMALICVLNNGPFEAAGLCYDEREFEAFSEPSDPRPKLWMLLPKKIAYELADYNPGPK